MIDGIYLIEKLNSNIRCIEMRAVGRALEERPELNSNIRCIEIATLQNIRQGKGIVE